MSSPRTRHLNATYVQRRAYCQFGWFLRCQQDKSTESTAAHCLGPVDVIAGPHDLARDGHL